MRLFLSGNEAIAYGLLESRVRFITGYPGTPSSEILPMAIALKLKYGIKGYFEWSVNEKVAFEEAYSASLSNIDSAVTFKQVGLNVAMDPFMNAAIVGCVGGFSVISVDDPGPHSSQTEQDSRFLAFFAKIPVLDPSTPKEAYDFAIKSNLLSKQYSIPVMLRSSTRISHSRGDIEVNDISDIKINAYFKRDANRFAATPHYRYLLHKKLNAKIEQIKFNNRPRLFFSGENVIITSGISFAYIYDIARMYNLENKLTIAKFDMPYPIDSIYLNDMIYKYKKAIVIEETYPVIEMQCLNRNNVIGKINGFVPNEGEITMSVCEDILSKMGILKKHASVFVDKPFKKPSLCPGCGHRSAFFAIREVFKNDAIYAGDIGCYTLGINLKAVDTVHCMGASVSFGFGFNKAFELSRTFKPVVATIGDSTFFHSGIPALIDAVHNAARFILVILDNFTIAMTGNQRTLADNKNTSSEVATPVNIKDIVKAIGVDFVRFEDAYNIDNVKFILLDALEYVKNNKKPAIVILKHACVYRKEEIDKNPSFHVRIVKELCKGCRICVDEFECPSILFINNKADIDTTTCIKCGQCVYSCPFNAIEAL